MNSKGSSCDTDRWPLPESVYRKEQVMYPQSKARLSHVLLRQD